MKRKSDQWSYYPFIGPIQNQLGIQITKETKMGQKLYFVELRHKETGKIINKIGVTHSKDVQNRFTPGYPEREGYSWFDIKVLFSMFFKRDSDAEQQEKDYLGRFPKCDINEYLGQNLIEEKFTHKNMSGISELRLLSSEERSQFLWKLHADKRELKR